MLGGPSRFKGFKRAHTDVEIIKTYQSSRNKRMKRAVGQLDKRHTKYANILFFS